MFKPKAYAFKINPVGKRLSTQSGGAFTALAEVLMEQKWIVYGVTFENNEAVYKRVASMKDLESLKGSKYVQAKLGKIYQSVEKDLLDGRSVLFSGTPCYVSAVLNYCKAKHIHTENLLTIEFLCHGVPSSKLFNYYLNNEEKEYGIKVTKVLFRDKHINGWGGYYSSYTINHFYKKVSENWLDIFRSDRYFRDSCYNCVFAKPERYADITISDFWNIKNALKLFGDINGVSMILVNNEKASAYVELFKIKGEMKAVSLEDINQTPLHHPTIKKNDGVDVDWENQTFECNADRIMNHYHKKMITLIVGIPMTMNHSFWKQYITAKIKGNSVVVFLKRKLNQLRNPRGAEKKV